MALRATISANVHRRYPHPEGPRTARLPRGRSPSPAHGQLKHLSGALARIAQVLDPDEDAREGSKRMHVVGVRPALNYEDAERAVAELADALKALSEAQAKGRELGL